MVSLSKFQVKLRTEGQSTSQSAKKQDFIFIKMLRDAFVWVSELGHPPSFSDFPARILLGRSFCLKDKRKSHVLIIIM